MADDAKEERSQQAEPEAVEAEVVEETEAAEESEAATPEDELAAAKQEAQEWQEKYLRLHAEWDTYRRRMKEQRAEEKQRATEALVENLIPVVDDFDRTLAYAKENGESGLLGGVEAVYNKFTDALTKDGLEIIDPAGQPYDALLAQAVGVVEDPTVPDETVSQVFQKGYRMGSKVLRPAMVTVTSGGPKREVPEEESE
ncbi:MAG: nucleotide exchange factor GrpE [Coriobacteriia bacterium]|nr:nucleotide exchange factor GrpE [Coriobacteriia bacterium]